MDCVFGPQLLCNLLRACHQPLGGSLAIRSIGVVGQANEMHRGSSARSVRNTLSPPTPLSRTPTGWSSHLAQALASEMPLNSPVAMRWLHSAGPVMWTLVPPESTATVTGISTTSNS